MHGAERDPALIGRDRACLHHPAEIDRSRKHPRCFGDCEPHAPSLGEDTACVLGKRARGRRAARSAPSPSKSNRRPGSARDLHAPAARLDRSCVSGSGPDQSGEPASGDRDPPLVDHLRPWRRPLVEPNLAVSHEPCDRARAHPPRAGRYAGCVNPSLGAEPHTVRVGDDHAPVRGELPEDPARGRFPGPDGQRSSLRRGWRMSTAAFDPIEKDCQPITALSDPWVT
jgi:hypothetical protein